MLRFRLRRAIQAPQIYRQPSDKRAVPARFATDTLARAMEVAGPLTAAHAEIAELRHRTNQERDTAARSLDVDALVASCAQLSAIDTAAEMIPSAGIDPSAFDESLDLAAAELHQVRYRLTASPDFALPELPAACVLDIDRAAERQVRDHQRRVDEWCSWAARWTDVDRHRTGANLFGLLEAVDQHLDNGEQLLDERPQLAAFVNEVNRHRPRYLPVA